MTSYRRGEGGQSAAFSRCPVSRAKAIRASRPTGLGHPNAGEAQVTNEAEVYFSLFGDGFDPDEITRAVGFVPTSVKRAGSKRREEGALLPRYSSWNVSSGNVEGDFLDIYEMASTVVSRLAPLADQLDAVKRKLALQARLQVVVGISTDDSRSTPAIGFDPAVIAFLCRLGASVDIDIYRNSP